MKTFFKYFILLVAFSAKAQVPSKPSPARLVNNFSKEFPNFITPNESDELETQLQNFSNQTSNQICIVIVDDLGGQDQASYATEIGNKWGVGQNDFKNGVVILIKPTGGKGQRNLFIAVGYGLEGAIPDLLTKRIRENDIEPLFADGRFYEGLQAGITSLMQAAKGEYHAKGNVTNGDENNWVKKHPILFIIIVLIILFILMKGSGGRGGTYYGGGFIGGLGGGFGGRNSGGGGGSFGGFGGGSFGGGGSGGNW